MSNFGISGAKQIEDINTSVDFDDVKLDKLYTDANKSGKASLTAKQTEITQNYEAGSANTYGGRSSSQTETMDFSTTVNENKAPNSVSNMNVNDSSKPTASESSQVSNASQQQINQANNNSNLNANSNTNNSANVDSSKAPDINSTNQNSNSNMNGNKFSSNNEPNSQNDMNVKSQDNKTPFNSQNNNTTSNQTSSSTNVNVTSNQNANQGNSNSGAGVSFDMPGNSFDNSASNNNVEDATKVTITSINSWGQEVTTEIDVNTYKMLLESFGLNDMDIEQVLSGKISQEELFEQIENEEDNTRRVDMMYASYLQAYGLEYNNIADLEQAINDDNNRLNELYKQKIDSENYEIDAIMNIITRLKMGENLDDILNSTIVAWQYTDENGNINYKYEDPYMSGYVDEVTYTPLTFEEMYKDSELLAELRANLTVETIKPLFSKNEKTIYRWTETEAQEQFFSSISDKYGDLVNNRDGNLENINSEIKQLEVKVSTYQNIYDAIKEEVDYYINNVDSYLHADDFDTNNTFNSKALETIKALQEANKNKIISPSDYDTIPTIRVTSKEEIVNLISCMLNGEGGNLSNGYLSVDGVLFPITSNDDLFNHYLQWLSYVNEEEKLIFNYIYNTEGIDSAYNYLNDVLSSEVDKRWLANKTLEDQEYASEHPILSSIGSIIVTPFEGIGAMYYSLNSYFTGQKIRRVDVYSSGDIWRAQVASDIAKNSEVLSFVYSTGMSMLDSLELIGISVATGGVATPLISATLMGSRAYVSTLNDALDRGLSDGEAVALAFTSSIVETAMESYSVSHLLNLEEKLGENVLKLTNKIASNISNPAIANLVTKGFYVGASALSQGLVEGEEELATEILNYVADIFIAKDLSNYTQSINNYILNGDDENTALIKTMKDFSNQAFQAFLGGFVSGLTFGSFGGTKTTVRASYAIANDMYNKLNGMTKAQQFAQVLEVNRSELQAYNEAVEKAKNGEPLSIDELNLLKNGTTEMQAAKALKYEIISKIKDIIKNIKLYANLETTNYSNNTAPNINTSNNNTAKPSSGIEKLQSILEGIIDIKKRFNISNAQVIQVSADPLLDVLASEDSYQKYIMDGMNQFDDLAFEVIKETADENGITLGEAEQARLNSLLNLSEASEKAHQDLKDLQLETKDGQSVNIDVLLDVLSSDNFGDILANIGIIDEYVLLQDTLKEQGYQLNDIMQQRLDAICALDIAAQLKEDLKGIKIYDKEGNQIDIGTYINSLVNTKEYASILEGKINLENYALLRDAIIDQNYQLNEEILARLNQLASKYYENKDVTQIKQLEGLNYSISEVAYILNDEFNMRLTASQVDLIMDYYNNNLLLRLKENPELINSKEYIRLKEVVASFDNLSITYLDGEPVVRNGFFEDIEKFKENFANDSKAFTTPNINYGKNIESVGKRVTAANQSFGIQNIEIFSLKDLTAAPINLKKITRPTEIYFTFKNTDGTTTSVFAPKSSIELSEIANKINNGDYQNVNMDNTLYCDVLTGKFYSFTELQIIMEQRNEVAKENLYSALNKILATSNNPAMIQFVTSLLNDSNLKVVYDLSNSRVDNQTNTIHLDADVFNSPNKISVVLHELGHHVHNEVNGAKVPKGYIGALLSVVKHFKNNSSSIQNYLIECKTFYENAHNQAVQQFEEQFADQLRQDIYSDEHLQDVRDYFVNYGLDPQIMESELQIQFDYIKQGIIRSLEEDIILQNSSKYDGIQAIINDMLFIASGSNFSYVNANGEIVQLSEGLTYGHSGNYYDRTDGLELSFHEMMAEFNSGKMYEEYQETTEFSDTFIAIFGQEMYDFMNSFWSESLECYANGTTHNYDALGFKDLMDFSFYTDLVGLFNAENITQLDSINCSLNSDDFDVDYLLMRIPTLAENRTINIDVSNLTDAQINSLIEELFKKGKNLDNINLFKNGQSLDLTVDKIVLNSTNVLLKDGKMDINILGSELAKYSQLCTVIVDFSNMSTTEINQYGIDLYLRGGINFANVQFLLSDGSYFTFDSLVFDDNVMKEMDFGDIALNLMNLSQNILAKIDISSMSIEQVQSLKETIGWFVDSINLANVQFILNQNGKSYTMDYETLTNYLNSNGDVSILDGANVNAQEQNNENVSSANNAIPGLGVEKLQSILGDQITANTEDDNNISNHPIVDNDQNETPINIYFNKEFDELYAEELKEWIDNLSDDVEEELKTYIGLWSRKGINFGIINAYMRGKLFDNEGNIVYNVGVGIQKIPLDIFLSHNGYNSVYELISDLRKIVNDINETATINFKGTHTLYRATGIQYLLNFIGSISSVDAFLSSNGTDMYNFLRSQIGTTYVEKSFTSTTTNLSDTNLARFFIGKPIRLEIETKENDSFIPLGMFNDESEILFKANQAFQITDVYRDGEKIVVKLKTVDIQINGNISILNEIDNAINEGIGIKNILNSLKSYDNNNLPEGVRSIYDVYDYIIDKLFTNNSLEKINTEDFYAIISNQYMVERIYTTNEFLLFVENQIKENPSTIAKVFSSYNIDTLKQTFGLPAMIEFISSLSDSQFINIYVELSKVCKEFLIHSYTFYDRFLNLSDEGLMKLFKDSNINIILNDNNLINYFQELLKDLCVQFRKSDNFNIELLETIKTALLDKSDYNVIIEKLNNLIEDYNYILSNRFIHSIDNYYHLSFIEDGKITKIGYYTITYSVNGVKNSISMYIKEGTPLIDYFTNYANEILNNNFKIEEISRDYEISELVRNKLYINNDFSRNGLYVVKVEINGEIQDVIGEFSFGICDLTYLVNNKNIKSINIISIEPFQNKSYNVDMDSIENLYSDSEYKEFL